MKINIPVSPIIDDSGRVTAEWLIFFNELTRIIDKIEQAQTPSAP